MKGSLLNAVELNNTWGGWLKKWVIRRTPPERVEELEAFLQQIDDLLTPKQTLSQDFLSSLTIRCGMVTGAGGDVRGGPHQPRGAAARH